MSTVPSALDPNLAPQPATSPLEDWYNQPDPNTPPDPQGQPIVGAPQAPPTPAPDTYFLRSDTGTVYKTQADAERGTSEKDRLIAQQKVDITRAQQLLAAQGVHLGQQPPQPAQPQGLIAALATAVDKKDMTFDQAIATLIQQQTQAAIQPLMPMVEQAAMSRAVEAAGTLHDPNIPAFYRSPAYTATLAKWHGLRTAIQTASATPYAQTPDGRTYADLLPEFLAQAYLIAKAAAPAAAPVQRPAPQSATPPQTIRPGFPQGAQSQTATPYAPPGGFRDPFADAWANVPDIPLTREALGG